MKTNPDYPLPSGELGEDEIVCQLVYLPDRPEYWQALITELHFLSTWQAWERDPEKRGKNAASNWRDAFELTIGCWRMACLDQLQDDVAAILELMKLPHSCCDGGDYTDGDQYTDRVEDGVGDVPQNIIDAGYAEDAADWDGFDDYKCMIAHVTVNNLEEGLRKIVPLIDTTGAVLGVVAALAGIIAVIVGTGGLAIVFGIVAGIGATSLLYQAITDFPLLENLADKVETNNDALACAIYNADGDAAALVALNDEIDELFTAPEALVLKNMNLSPVLKALYSGRYDQQDIADQLLDAGYDLDDFDCECIELGEFSQFTDWETGEDEGWDTNSGDVLADVGRDDSFGYKATFTSSGPAKMFSHSLLNYAGHTEHSEGDKVIVNRVRWSMEFTAINASRLHLVLHGSGGDDTTIYEGELVHTWYEKIFSPGIEILDGSARAVMFVGVGSFSAFHVDEVTIDFDIDLV
jgi:hypothetical protein